MSQSENRSAIEKYFQTNLAVVEVQNGENQEEAWRRYLTDNPERAGAHVKIFHYPGVSPRKKENSEVLQFRSRENHS